MRIGYGRVSTRDQNHDAQREALYAAGCERIFLDTASGKLASRPELDTALMVAAPRRARGHPARPARPLARTPHRPRRRPASLRRPLVVLDHGLDTSTAVGRMFFHILGVIADFEHALLSERTVEGLQAARVRGRTGGQKPKLTPSSRIAQEMYDAGKHTVAQIAAEFGVSRPTIYRHLARLAEAGVQTETGKAAK